jgi:DNA topoisomerase 2-associated protein PAT1
MSFFGFDNNNLIEKERRVARIGPDLNANEDIVVYNWGADDYNDLGNALQEGGDDLNDETFGNSGPVGELRTNDSAQLMGSE